MFFLFFLYVLSWFYISLSRCVLQCNTRLSEVERHSVFAEYWGLASYARQREYLAAHMHRDEKLGPSGLTRGIVNYYLAHRGKKVQVRI